MKKSKILPLRGLDLPARPLSQCRALAWSSDAELAVAADDSVLIYVPEFPILDPARPVEEDEQQQPADEGTADRPEADGGGGGASLGVLPAGLPAEFGDEYNEGLMSEDSDDEDDEDDENRLGPDGNGGGGIGGGGGANLGGAADGAGGLDGEEQPPECQFSEVRRHIPVSYPPLHPDLNRHVWEAAAREMPVIHHSGGGDDDAGRIEAQEQPPRNEGGVEKEKSTVAPASLPLPAHLEEAAVARHPGAGVGVIGGSGASLNHVVAIGWSPAGVGRNGRPVLAVLTGVGSLAVYGEGGPAPFGSTARPLRSLGPGRGSARDLQSWVVLWAVGENFVVPGQEEYGYGEFIKSFAWCGEVGGGRALLAYVNDVRELVVLCVGTSFRRREADGLEEAVWTVQEVLRLETAGPHRQVDLYDPDFVPSESSYGLRWSPWVKGGQTWSCLLSYMDRHYVGFKKISVNVPTWEPQAAPDILCDPEDWEGRCVHLGADAFLEFEDMIWDVNNKRLCRGIIATPWVVQSFEVDLCASNRPDTLPAHPTDQCRTTYPSGDNTHNNPITGLVIHPVPLHTVSPSLIPLYTAVRLSATATNNPRWWESNAPSRPGGLETSPQWAAEIAQKITKTIPLGMAGQTVHEGPAAGNDDEDDSHLGAQRITFGHEEGEDDEIDNDDDDDDDDDDEEEDKDEDAAFDPWASEGPDVHPFRVRIWGIAMSPGGGTTAVLSSSQLAVRPEKDTWSAHQSSVLFETQGCRATTVAAPPAAKKKAIPPPYDMEVDDRGKGGSGGQQQDAPAVAVAAALSFQGLSTEARLWEWMYGGGDGVPGLTPSAAIAEDEGDNENDENAGHIIINPPGEMAQERRDAQATARRQHVLSIFAPYVARQTCAICADGNTKFILSPLSQNSQPAATTTNVDQNKDDRAEGDNDENATTATTTTTTTTKEWPLDCFCENGHRVAVCGASGLAIAEPQISRCCGVCQSRCLNVDFLVDKVLAPAGVGEEVVGVIRREVPADVCARCGGKYLD